MEKAKLFVSFLIYVAILWACIIGSSATNWRRAEVNKHLIDQGNLKRCHATKPYKKHISLPYQPDSNDWLPFYNIT